MISLPFFLKLTFSLFLENPYMNRFKNFKIDMKKWSPASSSWFGKTARAEKRSSWLMICSIFVFFENDLFQISSIFYFFEGPFAEIKVGWKRRNWHSKPSRASMARHFRKSLRRKMPLRPYDLLSFRFFSDIGKFKICLIVDLFLFFFWGRRWFVFLFWGGIFFFLFPLWVGFWAVQKTSCLENAATSSWFASFVYFPSLFAGASFRFFFRFVSTLARFFLGVFGSPYWAGIFVCRVPLWVDFWNVEKRSWSENVATRSWFNNFLFFSSFSWRCSFLIFFLKILSSGWSSLMIRGDLSWGIERFFVFLDRCSTSFEKSMSCKVFIIFFILLRVFVYLRCAFVYGSLVF